MQKRRDAIVAQLGSLRDVLAGFDPSEDTAPAAPTAAPAKNPTPKNPTGKTSAAPAPDQGAAPGTEER